MKIHTILFIIFVFLLSGCSVLNRDPDAVLGDTTVLANGAGTITCSEVCEHKSQCGTTDGNKAIMGGIDAPVVIGWNMMLADETAVSINSSQLRTVQQVNDKAEEDIFFYHVTANDGGKSGWIAGWCVEAIPQPELQTE